MHALPCPHCEATLSVTPARAGDDLACPTCQQIVKVPNLGKIKNLPLINGATTPTTTATPSTRMGLPFAICGALATIAVVIAVFCGIRYSLIEVPNTTQNHINEINEQYRKAGAAELIRAYESIEEFHMELALPHTYKKLENEKNQWGVNAMVALGTSGLMLLAAVGLGLQSRKAA